MSLSEVAQSSKGAQVFAIIESRRDEIPDFSFEDGLNGIADARQSCQA